MVLNYNRYLYLKPVATKHLCFIVYGSGHLTKSYSERLVFVFIRNFTQMTDTIITNKNSLQYEIHEKHIHYFEMREKNILFTHEELPKDNFFFILIEKEFVMATFTKTAFENSKG